MTAAFPGVRYHSDGACRDRRCSHLTVAQLHSYQHRAFVRPHGPMPTTVMTWVLDDDATFEAIPEEDQGIATGYMLAGGGVLLLGHRLEPVRVVRERLLACVLIACNRSTPAMKDGLRESVAQAGP